MANANKEHPGREVELKLRVDGEKQLQAIAEASAGKIHPPVLQINHLFDSPLKNLNRNKYVLRLRDAGTRRTLTIKGPAEQSADGVLASRPEEEIDIDLATMADILNGARSPLDVFEEAAAGSKSRQRLVAALRELLDGEALLYLGLFQNERTSVDTQLTIQGRPREVTLELDRTCFPNGVVHCEVELELPSGLDAGEAQRQLMALFERAGVRGDSAPAKVKRFYAALDGLEL